MKKYIDFIFKYQKLLLVVFALTMLGSLYSILTIKINTDFSLFSTKNTVYEDRINEMNETFGSSDQLILMVESDTFDSTTKDKLRTIQEQLENTSTIINVQGPVPEFLMMNGNQVSIDDITPEQLLASSEKMEEFSSISIQDGVYYFSFSILLDDTFKRSDLKTIESSLNDEGFTYYLAGDSYNQFKIIDYIFSILLFLPPLAILVILFVFRLQLGGIKPTLLSVFPAAVGSAWTFGIIGLLGNEVSILTAIVPVFTIVIGSADGLHFITHMQESLDDGLDIKKSLIHTLKVVGMPMIITTLTSMAGFLSLLSMNTDSVVDLAIFSALGVFIAGIATWFVLPLILSRGIHIQTRHKAIKHFDISNPLKKLIGVPAIIIAILFVIIGLFFSSKIGHEFDMLSIYKQKTIIAQNSEKVQEIKGGSIPVYIIYKSDDILTMDSMNELDDTITALKDTGLINSAMNPYRILQLVYANEVQGEIPNNLVLELMYQNISSDESSPLNEFMNVDKNIVRIPIFPKDMSNETLEQIERLVTIHSSHSEVTGVQYLIRSLNVKIGDMQRNSILIAIGVVFIMLLISLNSLKLALISILPIGITVFGIYGVMGIASIPLNITTVIIFSIAIGVGIDYAVHFSSVYKYHLSLGISDISKTYNLVSKPILTNAFGISLGLSVLLFSPLMIHTYVSSLMWVAMIISVLMTLTLIPTILIGLKQKIK
jgi:predicted RND superfamily exporter protein